jgi:hypothetical protein
MVIFALAFPFIKVAQSGESDTDAVGGGTGSFKIPVSSVESAGLAGTWQGLGPSSVFGSLCEAFAKAVCPSG